MPSTISYPVAPFSSCPQSFGSFPVELYPMSRYLKNYQSSKNLLNKIVSILLNCHTFFITWKARCKPRNSRTCGFQHKPQPVSLLCPRSAPHMISHTPAWPPHPAHPHHIHACTNAPLTWVPRGMGRGQGSHSPGSGPEAIWESGRK